MSSITPTIINSDVPPKNMAKLEENIRRIPITAAVDKTDDTTHTDDEVQKSNEDSIDLDVIKEEHKG